MSRRRLSARELIRSALDQDSWESWDTPVTDPAGADPAYLAALAEARKTTGVDEAVLTGAGRIRGRRVAAVVGEFRFLAGSIGVATARRVAAAVERATREELPLIAAPTSGGTRMQEGTVAFLQMANMTRAVAAHKAAGLPYLVYLRHPTTGGVFASWGSLGHVTVAEPEALIGFLGPRVYELLNGREFPAGVQTGENLFTHGLVDAVLPPEQVTDLAARTLEILCTPRHGLPRPSDVPYEELDDVPAWESVTRSRRVDRPGVRRLLRHAAQPVIPLHGTQQGEIGSGMRLALARFGAAPAVVLGQDRRGQTAQSPLDPGALRTARRGMRLAQELRLPLVTVIDTPGAALSREAEEGGLAGEIARCLADLIELPTPTLCVLLGEGTGGGALALLPADRVIAAEHAWLSPLPPEGASAIVHRTTERAPEMAAAQGVRSRDLLANGIVDRIVAERPDAADEPEAFLARLGRVIEHELVGLLDEEPDKRLHSRADRYRRIGG
ncbi:carboxyl transferase domain-containing protein [Cryptosporangium sp. NPDC051539]|uniref:carboxyl transferase domain-containing protein n=1 Tax=Cryptosporangium sp. NPDC051539 TaxID=3363962 RepID=UPI0037A7EF33